MERRKRNWIVRGAAVLLVFGMAFYAFRAGVGVSDREGLPDADLWTQGYYALGLFVLGGLDLGMPSGGPHGPRALLWVAYFLAPLITTSAVAEGVIKLLNPRYLDRFGLRDHVVIVGIGRVGMTFLQALREREPDRIVVVVDRDASRATVDQARRKWDVRFFPADVRHDGSLDSLHIERAHAVALLTDDDLVNLETAWRVASRAPSAIVLAHVADIGMRRAVGTVRTSHAGRARVRVFNSHRIAAEHLYRDHLLEAFAATEPRDAVVIAGFGRFGQTILEFVEDQAGEELSRVVLVDRVASALVRAYRDQVPREQPCAIDVIDGEMADPNTWDAADALLGGLEVPPVVVLGCDDDRLNIRAAVQLRSRWPDARLFVRCRFTSEFTRELSDQYDFTVLAVEGILREAMRAQQSSWLAGP